MQKEKNKSAAPKRYRVCSSVCRGCIVRRLSNGVRACPVCNVPTLPPLFSDIRLQRLVYLIVPGLFRSESEKRRHFRIVNPQCTPLLPPLGSPELTYDDPVSLSISEIGKITSPDDSIKFKRSKDKSNAKLFKNKTFYEITGETRYLKCPAGVTVRHLQRLLMLKRGWDDVDGTSPTCHRIEIMYEVDESETESRLQILETSWTLLDLACIFEWKNVSIFFILMFNVRGISHQFFFIYSLISLVISESRQL